MLDFHTPTIADKERVDYFVRSCGQIGCDITFANTYLWRSVYSIGIAFDNDTYYKCYAMGDNITGYSIPITKGDMTKAVDTVLADAAERGARPTIGMMSNANAELIHRLYKGRVHIREDRDAFDYIYERANLEALAGKKYHAKRNHISRFLRACESYEARDLGDDTFADAMSIAETWQQGNEDTGELDIIRDAFGHFRELGMFGLVLYADGKPVAMCAASQINDRVCDVNFEKALDFDGAYAMINREFAKRFDSYTQVNREENLGLEGIRKAKLSYHPDILYQKSHAIFEI